ncbi:MAG: hypothetical protein LC754_02640 [Acidobacteria bacterium]|nr:hypothetical protein [Acidobacteriota bacterium]
MPAVAFHVYNQAGRPRPCQTPAFLITINSQPGRQLQMLWNSPDIVNQPEVLMPLINEAQFNSSLVFVPSERELVMCLRALRSFFNVRNHPMSETESAAILTRDFKVEARITREALLQCLQLILAFGARQASPHFSEAAGQLNSSESSLNESDNSNLLVEGDALVDLAEALRTTSYQNTALLEHPTVSFHEWMSLQKDLEPELSQALATLTHDTGHSAVIDVQPHLLAITEKIKPDEFGSALFALFLSLSRSLDCLQFIGQQLKSDSPLKPILTLFALVREETRTALETIEKRTLRVEGVEGRILEALDGTAYAIRIELRKSFEHELVGLCQLRQPPQVYAKVETAHGLLRDCFQQSIVSLANIFDPALDGNQLFTSFQTKLEQSLALRRDLWRLLQLVHSIEHERDETSLPELSKALAAFRDGSLRHLMYKDWESYERFIEEIEAARGATELTRVLHRFNAYLDTLFGQVSMRAVLADCPFDSTETAEC